MLSAVTSTAIVLVAGAAAIHAVWNLLAKRGEDKLAFIWWTAVVGTVLLLPPVVLAGAPPRWTPLLVLQTTLAGLLRAAYFVSLSAAHARGDLSLVYPLARGIAPVLAPLLAILALQETVGPRALAGIASVAAGVYVTHARGFAPRNLLSTFRSLGQPYARFAALTGVITALYSVVDKWSLDSGAPPLWYAYLTIPVAGLLLTPLALRHRGRACAELRTNGGAIAAVAVMMTSGYLLILYALRLAPVSLVAPARELSIVFATVLGATALGEAHWRQRLVGACLIVAGVVTLASSAP
jgi:drug/metabolite transporter (DMT)-like permease